MESTETAVDQHFPNRVLWGDTHLAHDPVV